MRGDRRLLAIVLSAAMAIAGAARAEVIDPAADYPEGPLWREGRLYYAEMGADQVSAIAEGGKRVQWRERGCGPTSLAPWGETLLVLCHRAAALVALRGGRPIRRWDRADDGVPLQNPNDSSADGRGGVYFSDPGVFSLGARKTGAVYYLARDGAVRRVARGLRYPNGVLVDQTEQALYVDEHLERRVLRYPIHDDGSLGPASVFADLNALTRPATDYPEAGPDGLERGPDGDLYVCLYGEGRIVRLSREGRLTASIPVATPYLTNIAFGPDGSAYVTGAFENLVPPLRGQVERLPPDRLQKGRANR
jgi:gluconolactonase